LALTSLRLFALLFPLACLATGSSSTEIESVVDMAHGNPGEFAADALLRIAMLDGLPAARRVSLIEQAFARAAEAQQPYKRRSGLAAQSANAGFLQHAFEQELDALSLRTRAVQVMLPLDAAKARRLFADISPIDLPLVSCEDYLVFDVDRYYDALASITQRAFSPKEIQDGAQFQFLAERLATVHSPAQLVPAMRAIRTAGIRDADFASAVAAITEVLRKMAGDDRSFTYYLPDTGAEVLTLMEEARRRGVSPLPLAEAYRLYLVVNFSAPRCADNDATSGSASQAATANSGSAFGPPLDSRSAEAIQFFNQSIRLAPLQPIQNSEAAASARAGAASGLRSCESGECKALAQQYRTLIFNSSGSFSSATRDSSEWQAQMQQFLLSVADWQDTPAGDAAQQFREKCALYGDLIGLLPDGHARELALRAMLEFLQHSRQQQLSRIEWLLPVNTLIGRAGLDPLGWSRLAEDLRRANDAAIALYARLEQVAPRTPAAILQLM
jgi:hypothetical protein